MDEWVRGEMGSGGRHPEKKVNDEWHNLQDKINFPGSLYPTS